MSNVVKWLGHSTFLIETASKNVLMIDPWLNDNPTCSVGVDDIEKADVLLVTHDHADHIGDVAAVAEKTGATVVACVETTSKMMTEMGISPERLVMGGVGMNIGGTVEIKGIKATMTQSYHTSLSGAAVGYIITLEDGKVLYHPGDTGIFAGMELIGGLYPVDLAMVPIGGLFTMDPYQAAHSLRLLKPKMAVPMHYRTFPILEQTPDRFVREAEKIAPDVEVMAIKEGGEIKI